MFQNSNDFGQLAKFSQEKIGHSTTSCFHVQCLWVIFKGAVPNVRTWLQLPDVCFLIKCTNCCKCLSHKSELIELWPEPDQRWSLWVYSVPDDKTPSILSHDLWGRMYGSEEEWLQGPGVMSNYRLVRSDSQLGLRGWPWSVPAQTSLALSSNASNTMST
jgi:hypothetical protein